MVAKEKRARVRSHEEAWIVGVAGVRKEKTTRIVWFVNFKQAIASGTSWAAKLLGLESEVGSVQAGKCEMLYYSYCFFSFLFCVSGRFGCGAWKSSGRLDAFGNSGSCSVQGRRACQARVQTLKKNVLI
jgi:hypothetical protein